MIAANDFARQWADVREDVLRAVEQVGASGWYILGEFVRRFEKALAAHWDLPHAAGVASGLDAIEIALRVLGCGPGDFVLTSPISAFATPLAILKLGATPVFADCDAHGLIDLNKCRRILAARPEIRFFVPVHLYGHCLDMKMLVALVQDFSLAMVEDCAQSIGASCNGVPCGSAGQFAATSFYPTKNLGAMGDGGAVLCSSEALDKQIRILRDYGQSAKCRHDVAGYNSRLDELQAAILCVAQLPRLGEWTKRRRAVAAAYLDGIDNPLLELPRQPEGSSSVWHLFPVLVPDGRKADAMAYFKSAGVGVGEHYPMALIEQNALPDIFDSCPVSRRFCRRELSLPVHPYLTRAEVQAVIAVANSWR